MGRSRILFDPPRVYLQNYPSRVFIYKPIFLSFLSLTSSLFFFCLASLTQPLTPVIGSISLVVFLLYTVSLAFLCSRFQQNLSVLALINGLTTTSFHCCTCFHCLLILVLYQVSNTLFSSQQLYISLEQILTVPFFFVSFSQLWNKAHLSIGFPLIEVGSGRVNTR